MRFWLPLVVSRIKKEHMNSFVLLPIHAASTTTIDNNKGGSKLIYDSAIWNCIYSLIVLFNG